MLTTMMHCKSQAKPWPEDIMIPIAIVSIKLFVTIYALNVRILG